MDKATKEKILEMACLCEGCLEKSYRDIDGCWDCENRGTYDGAVKMAEWKRQQMIEKTIDWLKENADKYVGRALEEYDMQYYGCISIDNLIEDFKKAMKEE